MAYRIVYKESVEKDLKGLSREMKAKILDHIESDLTADPRGKSRQLKGNLERLWIWKYEIRPYRVIYTIVEKENTILIVRIGRRKEVYRRP